MKRYLLNLVCVGLAIAGISLAAVRNVSAQSLSQEIVGAWALAKADGYGAAPLGTFMLDGNRHFAAMLMRSDLPKYASNIRSQGTPAEYKATVEGSIAFFGIYSVSGADLNLHVLGSTFANWIGTDQKRTNVSISADEMMFTQPNPSGG